MATEYDWFKFSGKREESQLAKKLHDAVHCIHGAQSPRQSMDAKHLRLYSEREYRSKLGKDRRSVAIQAFKDLKRPGAPLNLIRNGTNAAVSMVCRGRPMPFFVTDGSDWLLQRQTRKRHRFVNGILHREQYHLMGQLMAQQGSIFGTGLIHVLRTPSGPKLESVFTPEILVDEVEGQYGQPPNIYRVRPMDRGVLAAMYPDAAKAIERAPVSTISGNASTSNQIDVIWGWHMAIDDEPGFHACAIDGGEHLLYSQEYKHARAPFVEWRWNPEPIGWHGTGIPQEGAAIQYEVNMLLLLISQNIASAGNLKVLLDRGSKVMKSHINNMVGTIIEYNSAGGNAPIFSTPATIDAAVVDHLRWLCSQFYQNIGISELNATSMTPAASMSGKARLVHENSESQRFLTTQRRYDHAMSIDLAERVLEAAEDCHKQYGDIEVMYSGSNSVEPIRYSDITGPRDSFDITCFSASGLSNSVMGRYDQVTTAAAAGYYTPEEAKLLMDLPSTGATADDDRAINDNIEVRLARIMEDGTYIPPDDTLPLQAALKRANIYLSRAEVMAYNPEQKRRIPPEHLEMLREWRDDVINLIGLQNQPAPPIPADPAAAPSQAASPTAPAMAA